MDGEEAEPAKEKASWDCARVTERTQDRDTTHTEASRNTLWFLQPQRIICEQNHNSTAFSHDTREYNYQIPYSSKFKPALQVGETILKC